MLFRDILMVAGTQGGGKAASHTYGSELFPQPNFAGTTGLTLVGGSTSVSGGLLTFPNADTGSCAGALNAGLSTGDTAHVIVVMTTSTATDILVKCGNAASGGGIGSINVGTIPSGSPAGTYTFDAVVGAGHAGVALTTNGVANPGSSISFSGVSVTKQLT